MEAGPDPRSFAGARRARGAAGGAAAWLPFVYEIRAFGMDAAVGNGTGREGSAAIASLAFSSRAARKADGVAVIWRRLRGDLVERGIDPGKIIVSPNGVDMGLFGDPPARDSEFAHELGLEDADTVGFIGSFYDYEGWTI